MTSARGRSSYTAEIHAAMLSRLVSTVEQEEGGGEGKCKETGCPEHTSDVRYHRFLLQFNTE